jgi:hypothetical protein
MRASRTTIPPSHACQTNQHEERSKRGDNQLECYGTVNLTSADSKQMFAASFTSLLTSNHNKNQNLTSMSHPKSLYWILLEEQAPIPVTLSALACFTCSKLNVCECDQHGKMIPRDTQYRRQCITKVSCLTGCVEMGTGCNGWEETGC